MKTFYVIIVFFLIGLLFNAQPVHGQKEVLERPVSHQNFDAFYSGSRNLIYAEDFSDSDLTGWTILVESGPCSWEWTDVGSQGEFPGAALESTTSSNGWVILDSDLCGAEGGDIEIAYLTSPTIDCSNHTEVAVCFEQYYRRYGPAAEVTSLEVSIDGGNEWESITFNEDIDQAGTPNPDLIQHNITALAAGEPDVRLRFRWEGTWGYGWQIDDLSVTDPSDNPFGCGGNSGIGGSVFLDDDGNCEEDDGEFALENATINLLNDNDEVIATTYTTTNEITNFYFDADSGSYTVQLVTENLPFQVSCDEPGASQSTTLNFNTPTDLGVDFGVECVPGIDNGVQSIVSNGWVFPGQQHELRVAAGNFAIWYGLPCAVGSGGTVTINIDGPVSYVEPMANALTPVVSNDIQLSYSIADFTQIDFEDAFGVILETDTSVQGGELVCVDVTVEPIDDDPNPENNTYNTCYEVVNSYDPNIKQVWPQDVEPGFDDYFNYTIYFQNTGNAPAFNIEVRDTLDTNLDLSTFEMTAYSHDCMATQTGDALRFYFNNIMLPDSTSDFEGSIGYVQYRIKPIADLPLGTVIENTAHIFFDFNDAIVTNTTQNEYVINTGVDQPQQQLATVFPNPGTGHFNVLFRGVESGLTTHLEVYNLSGQQVLQQQVNENRITLDLTEYPSGIYLLHVRNERGSEAVKLMKQ